MKRFLQFFFGSCLGILVAGIFLTVGIFWGISKIFSEANLSLEKPIDVKPNTILYLNLDKPIVDKAEDDGLFLSSLTGIRGNYGLNEILSGLKKAKTDDAIVGVYLSPSTLATGWATIEEIRNALSDFKESGKFVIAHSNYYAQKAYYLSSVADKVYLTPLGNIDFRGLSSQVMFFKDMFKKIGVQPQIVKVGKFKSAIEPLIATQMSEENKLQVEKLTETMWEHILVGISKSRNIAIDRLNNIADELIVGRDDMAVSLGFVDSLKYKDEITEELKTFCEIAENSELNMVALHKYDRVRQVKKNQPKDKIAVIYASGAIGINNESTMGIEAIKLSKIINKVRKDTDVKAIVLRINSPGGSALGSEIIWREVHLAASANKPLIVSMGDVAASGGYYMACAADAIVANPLTVTGSIGVFGVLLNAKELLNNKAGITVDGYNTNKHSDFDIISGGGPFYRSMNTEERKVLQQEVEHIYEAFMTRVSEGRKLEKRYVDAIGEGRVWSGVDAKKLGLVDAFGGLYAAIRMAEEKSGISDYVIENYPKYEGILGFLLSDVENIKTKLLTNELNEEYNIYKTFRKMKDMKGVQAIMPYEIEIN